MKRRIILNADDFGWDPEASKAILDLASLDRIDSTTVMANLVEESDLLALLKFSQISVGIHLNLSTGKPLSSPQQVSTIVDPITGNFYSSFDLWTKYNSGRIKPEHIVREIQQQLAFFYDHGVNISHADSHQHIHIYPGLGHLIQNILKKKKITKLRNCRGRAGVDRRRWIIKGFNQFTSVKKAGFVTTDGLCSAFSVKEEYNREFFLRNVIMDYLNVPLYELMVHPATSDKSGSPLHRTKEYDFLKSDQWIQLLDLYKLERTNWHKL